MPVTYPFQHVLRAAVVNSADPMKCMVKTLGAFGGVIRMLPGLSFKPEGSPDGRQMQLARFLILDSPPINLCTMQQSATNLFLPASPLGIQAYEVGLPMKATAVIADDIFWQIPLYSILCSPYHRQQASWRFGGRRGLRCLPFRLFAVASDRT